MKKKNEKLKARVEALENRVRTLEAMFNSLSAVSACAPRGAEVPNGGSLSAAMHMAAEPSKHTQSAYAPPCGLNEKAWELMEKARKGGLLDEEYRPTGSRTEAALLAGAIAYDSHLEKKWKVFENLWCMKRLGQAYFRAQYFPNSSFYMKNINKILDTPFDINQ